MKLFAKIIVGLCLFYVFLWLGGAVYFSYAERHKGLLESNLSSVFKRPVSIAEVHTAWRGFSPIIQLNGFRVEGDTPDQPVLAFASLSAEIAPLSLLQFWPRLVDLAVEQPVMEIVSLPDNRLRIAGFTLGSNRSAGLNPKRLISWLLNHQSASWHDGDIIWQRKNGELKVYSEISFVYQRVGDERDINAAMLTDKGPFAFTARSRGNVLEAENWDASLEVLGDYGQRLLSPDDLSLVVENGRGNLELKTLNIQRIEDFLLITGLADNARWLFDSELSGRLHDAKFSFSGPLLEISDWTLSALASDVAFQSTGSAPGMNNLAGRVDVSAGGGSFEFGAEQANFDWPQWFDKPFLIDQAAGEFHWSIAPSGEIEVVMSDGMFEDSSSRIWDVNASCSLDSNTRNISNLAQLFKLGSVDELSFEQGELVQQVGGDTKGGGQQLRPLHLDASAQFELKSLPATVNYLPNDPRLERLRTWWSNAFMQGGAFNGQLSYQGEISKTALKEGKAQLRGSADFSDVEIDYGFQRDWPILRNAKGSATLENDLLTIIPTQAWLEEDEIVDSRLTIDSLFYLDRELQVTGSTVTSLPRVAKLLFDGPLIKPEQRGREMPIEIEAGRVSADVKVTIPLRKTRDARVEGQAEVTSGQLVLPQGVPVNDVSASIRFTERSAEADNIKAQFLGGDATARLVTTEPAQPPKLRMSATGEGDIKAIEPWVGEHIVSIMEGFTDWSGTVDIDGPKVDIATVTNLQGVTVTGPAPLAKFADEETQFSLSMQTGSKQVQQKLFFSFGELLQGRLHGDLQTSNTLLDHSLIRIADAAPLSETEMQPGINFLVDYPELDLDQWLAAIIDLAQLETKPVDEPDTSFLDAMRTVKIQAADPIFLGRQFGALDFSAVSMDGAYWIASISGDNVSGTAKAEPREDVGNYRFNLSRFHLVEAPDNGLPPDPIDYSLQPASYPRLELLANELTISGKPLGRLHLIGAPAGEAWSLSKFDLVDRGIQTSASGRWVNNEAAGSYSSFTMNTTIDEAGNVLDDMEFSGLIKKGHGSFTGNLNWIGAPHEFDFARLNGDFDLRIRDGELVKIEPGSSKLFGLFNFNAIARRLTLDFRDVFSSGLQFDRMRYAGLLADGEAIMRDAYIFTPAVFVQMEGKVDLDKELIDMEIHASPELGGNLTLLSALANPTAGALVFLTQQIFKDQMRSSNLRNYRALGTWEDFELVEFEEGEPVPETPTEASPGTTGAAGDNPTQPVVDSLAELSLPPSQ
ncbi:MAG: AsmA-like C-terminal region-containing protein [Pseudomonadota bacterium]